MIQIINLLCKSYFFIVYLIPVMNNDFMIGAFRYGSDNIKNNRIEFNKFLMLTKQYFSVPILFGDRNCKQKSSDAR